MKKIVINRKYGGFGLSYEAFKRLRELNNPTAKAEPDLRRALWSDGSGPRKQNALEMFCRDIDRNDPQLILVVEEMGAKASGRYAQLEVIEIPDDVDWTVEEKDGFEHIAEVHRVWP